MGNILINKLKTTSGKFVAIILSIILVLSGFGVYFALAAGGGGGGDIDPSGPAGSNYYTYAIWDDQAVEDKKTGELVPKQGWGSDSIDYFWKEVNHDIDDWVGLRFDVGSTSDYQRSVFDEACNEALKRCKKRENQKARIAAVSVFFSNSTAQGGKVALMAQYNERHYQDFFEKPKEWYDHKFGALVETYGNVMDLNHDWDEPCNQVDALPGERWMDYLWRITGEDTCGGVDGKAPYSVIAIAVNEDMMDTGKYITFTKHVEGEDAPKGSYERLLYESTKNSPYYDLSGAEFQVFKSDGVTPVVANKVDEDLNPTGEKINMIFKTKADGSCSATVSLRDGEYWLREVKAPAKGYYQDTDGDGIPDKDDTDTGLGKKIVIKGEDITVNGKKLSVYDQYKGKNRYCFEWTDAPISAEIKLNKRIEGELDAAGSYKRLLYEATQNNSCYDLSGALFELKNDDETPVVGQKVGSSTTENVVFTTASDGSSQTFKVPLGEYWLTETRAPNKGFYKDTDGDGEPDEFDTNTDWKGRYIAATTVTSPKTIVVDWYDRPMDDPQPIFLQKRDSLTGGLTQMPEGDGDTNGAKYRFAYYKGVYNKIEQIPGYDASVGKVTDWSKADTTAIWTTHSFTDASGVKWSGKISFDIDTPSEGTWKYNDGVINRCPMGTLLIQEVSQPRGYLIDDRQYLFSITDDGTHTKMNIAHTPWNADGSTGNSDWNPTFANEYELNGDRDDIASWS